MVETRHTSFHFCVRLGFFGDRSTPPVLSRKILFFNRKILTSIFPTAYRSFNSAIALSKGQYENQMMGLNVGSKGITQQHIKVLDLNRILC